METAFVSADRTWALLLPAEAPAGTSSWRGPADHHDSPSAEGSGWAEQLADKPGIPLGTQALRGCCSPGLARKETARRCWKFILQRKRKAPAHFSRGIGTDFSLTAISTSARDVRGLPSPTHAVLLSSAEPFSWSAHLRVKRNKPRKAREQRRNTDRQWLPCPGTATLGEPQQQDGTAAAQWAASAPCAGATALSTLLTVPLQKYPVGAIRSHRAQGRNGLGEGTTAGPLLKLFCCMKVCSGGGACYLLYNASFQSNFNHFSYSQWPPRVSSKATQTACDEKQSHFSILAQYFNSAVFIAYRKFTESTTLEETSSWPSCICSLTPRSISLRVILPRTRRGCC